MDVDSFKTKGSCGYQEFRRHKSLPEWPTLPFGRTKRRPGLPCTPSTMSGAFHGTQTEAMCPEMDLLGSPGLCPEGPIN